MPSNHAAQALQKSHTKLIMEEGGGGGLELPFLLWYGKQWYMLQLNQGGGGGGGWSCNWKCTVLPQVTSG